MDNNTAKTKLARLCSTKELCEHDAREKLIKWGIYYDNADEIISWLNKEKFIDNNRFARFYVRDKYRFNKWGRIKIRYALSMKQVSNADINEAMNEINEQEYYNILINVVKAKMLSNKEDDAYKRTAKIHAHALSKGYESNLIFNAIDDIIYEKEDS